MTNLDPTQVHGLAQTWYDRADHIDTAHCRPSVDNDDPSQAVSRHGGRASRSGSSSGFPHGQHEWSDTLSATIDVWNGRWSAASSGHGVWQNAASRSTSRQPGGSCSIRARRNPPSPTPLRTTWMDCRYRGTPITTQFISAAHARDNVDRVMLFTSFGTYGINGGPGTFVVDRRWMASVRGQQIRLSRTWTDAPHYVTRSGQASDDRRCLCDRWLLLRQVDRCDGTWQTSLAAVNARLWPGTTAVTGGCVAEQAGRSLRQPYYGPTIRLQFVDLATHAVSELPITGAITDVAADR